MNLTRDDAVEIITTIAMTNGLAPSRGCARFESCYQEAFSRLKATYLDDETRSAEKFLSGPYGSGKTHFLREFLELARDARWATSEVTFTVDVDLTKYHVVYAEAIKQLRNPRNEQLGLRALLQACVDEKTAQAPPDVDSERFLASWIKALPFTSFEVHTYGALLQIALTALVEGDAVRFGQVEAWLYGDFRASLARELRVARPTTPSLYARELRDSLAQFVRHAGFRGLVLGFDEATQIFSRPPKKVEDILLFLKQEINALTRRYDPPRPLITLYAVAPEVIARAIDQADLQQRLMPGPGHGFFDGTKASTFAPVIDLTRRREDPKRELESIGRSLVEMACSAGVEEIVEQRESLMREASDIATDVAASDASSSSRREMAKRVSKRLYEVIMGVSAPEPSDVEAEV